MQWINKDYTIDTKTCDSLTVFCTALEINGVNVHDS